jgi:hypothetical protein
MSSRDRSEVEAFVSKLAKDISGRKQVSLEDYVYADLRITGCDAVEFYQVIEERYSVDLRAITEVETASSRRWFLWIRRNVEPRDLPLDEIVTFIVEE